MRTLLSLAVATVAIVVFAGFFITHGVLSYVTDAGDVVNTAQQQRSYEHILDATQVAFAHDLSRHNTPPQVAESIGGQFRAIVAEQFPKQWFYTQLRAAYQAILDFLAGEDNRTIIELAERRRAMTDALAALAVTDGTDGMCRDDSGPTGPCAQAVAAATAAYRDAARRTIAGIPDRIVTHDVLEAAENTVLSPDGLDARGLGSYLDWAKTVRTILLVALIGCGLVLLILHVTGVGRLYLWLGGTLTVAAAICLATVYAVDWLVTSPLVNEWLDRVVTRSVGHAEPGSAAFIQVASEFAGGALSDALHTSDMLVWILLAGSIAAVVAGSFLHRPAISDEPDRHLPQRTVK